MQMWNEDPKTQLTAVSVLRRIEKLFNNDVPLGKKIQSFLKRLGCIHFGIFKCFKVPRSLGKKFIVIGVSFSKLITV